MEQEKTFLEEHYLTVFKQLEDQLPNSVDKKQKFEFKREDSHYAKESGEMIVYLHYKNPSQFNQDWFEYCPLNYSDERYAYTSPREDKASRESDKQRLLKKLQNEINGDFIVAEMKFNPEIDIGICGIDFEAKKFITQEEMMIPELVESATEESKNKFEACWTSDGNLLLVQAAEFINGGTIRKPLPQIYQPVCKITLKL